MAEKALEQYRQEILAYLDMEYTQAQIIRALQERYGIEVKRSTLSDYIRALSQEESNGAAPQAMQADATAALMESVGAEIVDRLAQLIEGMQQLKQEGDDRHKAVTGLLGGAQVGGGLLVKIWLRALLITGGAWGVAVAALYGYVRGLPF